MRYICKLIILVFLICQNLAIYATPQRMGIDSLWTEFENARHDSIRILILNEKIGPIYRNFNPDSAIYYYKMAISLADISIEGEMPDEDNMQYFVYKANSLRYVGIAHAIQGHYDLAIKYSIESLNISEQIDDKHLMFQCINNIGVVQAEKGNYSLAIEYYNKSLDIAKELEDKSGISLGYINIGNINYFQGVYETAIKYYGKSLQIAEEIDDKVKMSLCYNNIGSSYKNIGVYDQAIIYLKKALSVSEKLGDKNVMAVANSNIAELHISLAFTEDDKISLYERDSLLKEAVDYGLKAINLAREINAIPRKNEASKTLMSVYKALGDYKTAFDYSQIYIATKDSMFHEEKTKAVTEMQIRYETEKNQQEIERQNLIIEKREIDYKRQRLRFNFLIAGFVLLGLLALVVMVAYRYRIKSNKIITEKNVMLEQAYEEIMQQKEELESQSNELEKINITLEERISKEIAKSRKKDFLLIQQSRQAAMGEMIANIAHQWRQPLNAVGIIVQNIQEAYEYDELNKEYLDKKVKRSMNLIQYMSQTISDFRDFFKPEKIAGDFDVKNTVIKGISFVEDTIKKSNIELVYELEDDVFAYGYSNEYAQVILNLLSNSKDALMSNNIANPKIEIYLSKIDNRARLIIEDNGGGIPDDIKNKVFEPYYTSKKEGEGTGLGLYMSKTIIEKHESGSIKFENTDKGVRFIIIV